MLAKLAEWRKAIVTGLGMVVTVLTATNALPIPSQWHVILGTTVGLITTVLTWLVPNKAPAVSGSVAA
jgi:hypothetical protein